MKAQIENCWRAAVLATCFLVVAGSTANAQPALSTGQVTVIVDQTICQTGAVQCTTETTGHTGAAVAATNHNPARIVVQVLDARGLPVNNLPATAFTMGGVAIPAGGSDLTTLSCADCFSASATGGTYILFLHPIEIPNYGTIYWKSGTYVFQIQVTYQVGNTTVTARALARIDVPF